MHAAAGHLKCTYCICDALCMHVAELQRHLTQYHAHVATEHDLKTLLVRLTKEAKEIVGELPSPSQSEIVHLAAAQAVDNFPFQVTPWGPSLGPPGWTLALACCCVLDGERTALPLSLLYSLPQ